MSRRFLTLFAGILCGLVLFVPGWSAHAADYVVTDCGDSGAAGQLRARLGDVLNSGGGTITFSCAPKTIVLGSVLSLVGTDTPVVATIDGTGGYVLSGANSVPIFNLNGLSGEPIGLSLKNITLQNGYRVDGHGGAINNAKGTLTLDHVKFLNNGVFEGYNGGAISTTGKVTVTDSEFGNNSAGSGGAIYAETNVRVEITGGNFHDNKAVDVSTGFGGAIYVYDRADVVADRGTFTKNQAKYGGAIYGQDATTISVDRTTLSRNSASAGGGASNSYDGTVTLTKSTLNRNSADDGGGIAVTNSTSTLTNVTISANAAEYGGGLATYNGGTTVTNVTFRKNTATTKGGAINLSAGTLTLKNTVIVKGASGVASCSAGFGGMFNLSDDNSCNFGAGRNNVPNLLLAELADNGGSTLTHLPQAGSAVIDNGTGAGAPADDQRGVARPKGALYDVGAVEVDPCAGKPPKPKLRKPKNGKPVAGPIVTLKWNETACAKHYTVIVRIDAPDGEIVMRQKKYPNKQTMLAGAISGRTYFWQLTANGENGKSKSDKWSFTIK